MTSTLGYNSTLLLHHVIIQEYKDVSSGWKYPASKTFRIKVKRIHKVLLRLLKNLKGETHRDHAASIINQIESQQRVALKHSSSFESFLQHIRGFDQPIEKMRVLFVKWHGLLETKVSGGDVHSDGNGVVDELRTHLEGILEELVDLRRILKTPEYNGSEVGDRGADNSAQETEGSEDGSNE